MANRRAIILIPGIYQMPRGYWRTRLLNALIARMPDRDIKTESAGELGVALKNSPFDSLHLYEAYWMDFATLESSLPPHRKFAHAGVLLMFWMFSGVWRGFRVSRSITLGLITASLVMILWYLGVVVTLTMSFDLKALMGSGEQVPTFVQSAYDYFRQSVITTFAPYVAAAGFILAVPMGKLEAVASCIHGYIRNSDNGTGTGMRDQIRAHVADVMQHVYAQDYDEVMIIGHSFGGHIAIELLANWANETDINKTVLMTWGTPVAVVKYRSDRLQRALDRLVSEKPGLRWVDYYSRLDFLCSHIPDQRAAYGTDASIRVSFDASPLATISGKSHEYYFDHPDTTQALLDPAQTLARVQNQNLIETARPPVKA